MGRRIIGKFLRRIPRRPSLFACPDSFFALYSSSVPSISIYLSNPSSTPLDVYLRSQSLNFSFLHPYSHRMVRHCSHVTHSSSAGFSIPQQEKVTRTTICTCTHSLPPSSSPSHHQLWFSFVYKNYQLALDWKLERTQNLLYCNLRILAPLEGLIWIQNVTHMHH
jgi:hypothetical protein